MSTCPSTSLVAVPAATVANAAEAILIGIQAARQKERQHTITHLMTPRRGEWEFTRRWPFVRQHVLARTVAEAEALVDGPPADFHSLWITRWSRVYGEQKERAESYALAAKLSADGQVWLNLADAREVAEYTLDGEPATT